MQQGAPEPRQSNTIQKETASYKNGPILLGIEMKLTPGRSQDRFSIWQLKREMYPITQKLSTPTYNYRLLTQIHRIQSIGVTVRSLKPAECRTENFATLNCHFVTLKCTFVAKPVQKSICCKLIFMQQLCNLQQRLTTYATLMTFSTFLCRKNDA